MKLPWSKRLCDLVTQESSFPDEGVGDAPEPVVMHLHVLPRSVREIACDGEYPVGHGFGVAHAADADDTGVYQMLHTGMARVEVSIRGAIQAHEEFLLLAAATPEAALYYFYHRLLAPELRKTASRNRAHGVYEKKREYGYPDPIQDVHVWVAICEQLMELRRLSFRDLQPAPYYADTGCELFTGEQLRYILAACEERFHAASIPPNPQDDKEVRHD